MSARVRVGRAVAVAVAGLLLAACHGVPSAPAPRLRVAAALERLLAQPDLAGARIGVCVVDAATGERWAAHDDDRGFPTASNMKLVTAAVALDTLGPDHRAATELWARGAIAAGTLHGDLVLRGRGDPTLGVGTSARDTWAPFVAALRARGVQRVTGRVVGDDRWLGDEHLGLGWQWDYLDEDYAAPFGALCCHHNCVTVRVRPGRPVAIEPDVLPPPSVRVREVAAGEPTRLVVRRPLGSDRIEVSGTLAADARERTFVVAVADGAVFAAAGLAAELRAAGFELGSAVATDGDGPPPPAPTADEHLVHAHRSPPFAEWLRRLCGDSDNLYAEVALRSAARVATGDGGTAAAAGHALAVLRRLGVDTQRLVVADGSGLSRRNLVQPRQLAALLLGMWASPHRDTFVRALPCAGETGTLRTRLTAPPARGRVRAKTGFIARVVCLSGYVQRAGDESSRPLVFSVMLQDFTCGPEEAKAAVDAFVQQLAAAADGDADAAPAHGAAATKSPVRR